MWLAACRFVGSVSFSDQLDSDTIGSIKSGERVRAEAIANVMCPDELIYGRNTGIKPPFVIQLPDRSLRPSSLYEYFGPPWLTRNVRQRFRR